MISDAMKIRLARLALQESLYQDEVLLKLMDDNEFALAYFNGEVDRPRVPEFPPESSDKEIEGILQTLQERAAKLQEVRTALERGDREQALGRMFEYCNVSPKRGSR